jgi:hypothetical protein
MQKIFLAAVFCWLWSQTASAQYSTVTSPFNSLSNSYFEQVGVGFNLSGRNFFFQQNSFGPAVPPFGGFAPGAGANMGLNFRGDGFNGSLNFTASQGSRTSMVGQAPSVTLANGVPGGVFDTTISPFVISVIPVVNDAPMTPLAERLERIKAGERAPVQQSAAPPATNRQAESSRSRDPWRERLKAAQADGSTPTLSVAEIRRRKAAQDAAR